jgi:hypothetical protein
MKVLMKIENGKLVPPEHIRLVDKGEVTVELPAEAIRQEATSVRQQLDDLLGHYAKARPSATLDDDKRAWREHLEEKHPL